MSYSDHPVCLKCGESLEFVSKETYSKLQYDYTETTNVFYYKCTSCNSMFDERVRKTGIRHLALGRYEKAENLALQPRN